MTKPPHAFGQAQAVVLRWVVPHLATKTRADQYLAHKVGRISRAKAQRIILAGDFRTETGKLKSSFLLKGGEHVELWRMPPDEAQQSDLSVRVVYEDEEILVVNKPSDLVVHPSARYLYRTLTHWLRLRYPENPPRPCHRLDRETSGLLLAAKDKAAESAIKQAFAHNCVQKSYLAVVCGHLQSARTINCPLALQGKRGLVQIRMVRDEIGLASETAVIPRFYDDGTKRTLVECWPKTGRQHQIRAHLALEGFPVVGDKLYAMGETFFDAWTRGETRAENLEHPRQALHAYRLCLRLGKRNYRFRTRFPTDLLSLLPAYQRTRSFCMKM